MYSWLIKKIGETESGTIKVTVKHRNGMEFQGHASREEAPRGWSGYVFTGEVFCNKDGLGIGDTFIPKDEIVLVKVGE